MKDYPHFKKGEIEKVYKKLTSSEKKIIKDYLLYRKARGLNSEGKLGDLRRNILHLQYMTEKSFKKLNLKDLRELLATINSSWLTEHSKNHFKSDTKNFLKFLYKDWFVRFSNFDDLKLNSNPRNEKKINSKTIFTKEEVEKLIQAEDRLFWKTFISLGYEGGLRTGEVRGLKWEDINLNVDNGISEIQIYSPKTKKSRKVFVKETTDYLRQLKEQQESRKNKGIYVFHSLTDKNKPVNKPTISMWFRRLTKKTLGREGWFYLFRHSRATELYKLAKENKIAVDTATEFMGHTKSMSKVYTHLDSKSVEEMLKKQIYKINKFTPKEKSEIKKLRKELEEMKRNWKWLLKVFGFEKVTEEDKKKLEKHYKKEMKRLG